MTPVAIIALTLAGVIILLAAYGLFHERRASRRWAKEHRRIIAMHERVAAQNGRPHSTSVTHIATRHRQ
jgi:hypothetical protein